MRVWIWCSMMSVGIICKNLEPFLHQVNGRFSARFYIRK